MKQILVISALQFIVAITLAQDIIIKKNGEEMNARVVEVGSDIIRYKKFTNLDGPTYSIKKVEIFMIRYENGTKDVFNQAQKPSVTTSTKPTNPSVQKTNSTELPKGSFNINPLGLIQFGPIFQYEAKISERAYLAPHFRYAFAGVLTHLVFTEFEEDSELSAGTAAIGLGFKSFAQTSGNSWYYGGIVDYSWAKARFDVGQSSESEEIANTLSILSNTGYRWRSGRGGYVNVGLFAGLAFDLLDEERYVNGGDLIEDYAGTNFLAMLELSFGWDFKNQKGKER